ncbi:S8 family serine peptidase [Rhizohabitans arisaemae]|uniref:S8 family serine peptidase n=1 Tax=Rhizohabitans arisaemae TaxID=2720610 RepID=UPI0024B1D46E|nr:S8 family serine peptidase [Rhizohabitans arisaemae]
MRLRSSVTALAVVITGVVALTPPAGADPGKPVTSGRSLAPGQPGKQADQPKDGKVTLITGDRVTVLPGGTADRPPRVRVEPGKGREVSFAQRWRDGHLHVVPSDAMPLIAGGLLDERLFDVTQLLAWRYGDAYREDIPVIVQSDAETATPHLKAAEGTRSFPDLGLDSARIPKTEVAGTWKSLGGSAGAKTLAGGVTKLWLDGKRRHTLERSVPQIGAPTAWAQGLTGEGVTVAVLDSGYDGTHPDLRDVVVQAKSFVPGSPADRDTVGHGTHVASIIAGSGQASSGVNRGTAPGARLAVGKVGDENGIAESWILAGMTWAATEVKAKVVNMSLGGYDGPEIDPLEHAVNTLTAQTGSLFVVASGNSGPQSVGSPGSADAALTVGAVDSADRLTGFSSTGPRSWDKAVKPDITAPGDAITAAAAAGTAPGPYITQGGTSMAAPHVAGAAAILAQRHPTWTAGQLKAALIGSAVPGVGTGAFEQGAGRVDVARAVAQPVIAEPGTLSTTLPWPHTGGPVVKTVAYRNNGTAPLTLDVAVERSGAPLPTGLVELSARQVTVPAGGEAPVTVTLNPAGAPAGAHAGVIVARSGETAVRTPIGVHVEPESGDVSVRLIGRDGGPAIGDITFYDLAKGERIEVPVGGRGVVSVRLPVGDWNLYTDLFSLNDRTATLAHQPVRVTAATQPVVVDARQGRMFRFSVDEPSAVPDRLISLSVVDREGAKSWSSTVTWIHADPNNKLLVIPARKPGLSLTVGTVWHKQGAQYSPYRYDILKHHDGGFPEDTAHAVRTADLAKVTATYRSNGAPGGAADVGVGAAAPSAHPAFTYDTPVALPGTLTHYRTPGNTLTWFSSLAHNPSGHWVKDTGRTLRGMNETEVWNNAVAGPALQDGESARTGDELRYAVGSLFTEGTPGRYSVDAGTTGTVTLAKDGRTLARTEFADCVPWDLGLCTLKATVPAEEAVYTLTTSGRRNPSVSPLSTAVETVWTFRSARTAEARPLPLATVRFNPAGLDTANRARRGSLTPIPLRIERAPGGAPAPVVTSVRVEASADDGATWSRIPVLPGPHGTWTGFALNPKTGDHVSLRAVVTDASGGSVTQTITRAYGLAP